MDHRKPLTLSIIIPAYNEERHIKACLDAIAKQTEMPNEVILVDNNSTDDTARIAVTYPFVTIIKEPKQGIVFARNAGFDKASSEIIGRIDADTILPKNWVRLVKKYYAQGNRYNYALTGGGYFYNLKMPPKAVGGWIHNQVAIRLNRFIMGHYILWGSNMALTKEQWNAVKSLTCSQTDIHEDLDLAIHLNRIGYQIAYRSNIQVGVKMKRMFDDYPSLYENTLWWPRTLKRHNIKKWVLGWLGAHIIMLGSPILILVNLPFRIFKR